MMRRTFTKEAHVKEAVKEILKKHGIWYFMPAMTGRGRTGIPDFICALPPHGVLMGIETKLAGNKVTSHQEREILAIRQTGAHAFAMTQHDLPRLDKQLELMIARDRAKMALEGEQL
jgi:hypothetical protein